MAGEKPHLNIVVIGHVDHGKSSLSGRMLVESGKVSPQQLAKLQEEAKKIGGMAEGAEYAFILDQLASERERTMTIDVSHMDMDTPKYYITLIDAPGHRDFVKNMITGASQADAAVLVISARQGVQPQTQEHVFLAKVLGINQLIVAVNKMDAVNYEKEAYDKLVADAKALLQKVGYDVTKIPFIPVSAIKGDNVKVKSTNMPWYNGPILLSEIDAKFVIPPKPVDKPLRLPIQEVFTITGHGTVPVGRVETGVMKVGEMVVFEPAGVKTDIKSIEMHHQQLQSAQPGDNIGFSVKGVDKAVLKKGTVVGPVDKPPTVAEEFTAQIVVLQHPTSISVGYTPVLHIHTVQVAGVITEIVEKKDPKSGGTLQTNPEFIKAGDVAIVKIKPVRPTVVEKFSDFPPLGRFAIRDMGMTIAAGVVLDVTPRAKK